MANTMTTAFWGMTVNNYDDTDLALVRQGYPDFLRQIVYTLEKGETGTPHIQAYIKLFRQQRLSYVKKLFPRGNFKALTCDEYKLNAQRYAQKLDNTAQSAATITNNPFPDPIVELVDVLDSALRHFHPSSNVDEWKKIKQRELFWYIEREEFNRVREKPNLAKFYVSPIYGKVKKTFWRSLLENVCDTHTQTHNDKLFSHDENITNAEEEWDDTSQPESNGESVTEQEEDGSSVYNEGDSQTGSGTSDFSQA